MYVIHVCHGIHWELHCVVCPLALHPLVLLFVYKSWFSVLFLSVPCLSMSWSSVFSVLIVVTWVPVLPVKYTFLLSFLLSPVSAFGSNHSLLHMTMIDLYYISNCYFCHYCIVISAFAGNYYYYYYFKSHRY